MQKSFFLKFWVKGVYWARIFHLLSTQACKWLLPHPLLPHLAVTVPATDVLDIPWLPRASPPVADEETVNIQIRKGVQLAFATIRSFLSKSLCAHQSRTRPSPGQWILCSSVPPSGASPPPRIPHLLHPRQSFLSWNNIISLPLP